MNKRFFISVALAASMVVGLGNVGARTKEAVATVVTVPNRTVNVTSFGAVPNDGRSDTAAIQNAINNVSSRGGGIVDVPAGTFNVAVNSGGTAINMQSNVHLRMNSNAVLRLSPNNLANHRLLLLSTGDTNIRISGGTLIGERGGHIGTSGEWGHGVHVIGNVTNIEIANTTIRNFWGDGVSLENANFSVPNGIVIDRITADNNRRQGLSIIAGRNIRVTNSIFRNTNGTGPSDGIDIERDPPYDKALENVVINHNLLENNDGSGLGFVSASSPTVSARYNIIRGNRETGVYIGRTNGITVEDNLIYNNGSKINQNATFGDGVWLNFSRNNRILGNDISGSYRYGIRAINDVGGNQFNANRITNNRVGAIYVWNGQGLTITNNRISSNANNNVIFGGNSSATQRNNGGNVTYQPPAETPGPIPAN